MTAVEDGEPAASSEKPEPAAAPMPEAEGAAEPPAAPSTSAPSAEDSGAGGAEAAELPSECVKVAVRVRPLSSKEHAEGSAACVRFPQPNQIVIGKDRGVRDERRKDNTAEGKYKTLCSSLGLGAEGPEVSIGREAFAAACRKKKRSVGVWFEALRLELEEPGPGCLCLPRRSPRDRCTSCLC
eukprot:COSAG04_NODE_227_length_19396_cov_29.887547_7_plen_183_part_00